MAKFASEVEYTYVHTSERSIVVAIKLIVPSIFVHALNYYFINNRRPIVRTSVVTHCNNGTFSFCPALSVLFSVRCSFPLPRHSRTQQCLLAPMYVFTIRRIRQAKHKFRDSKTPRKTLQSGALITQVRSFFLRLPRVTSPYKTDDSCILPLK